MMFDICNLLMSTKTWDMAMVECFQLKRPWSMLRHPLFPGQRFTFNYVGN